MPHHRKRYINDVSKHSYRSVVKFAGPRLDVGHSIQALVCSRRYPTQSL